MLGHHHIIVEVRKQRVALDPQTLVIQRTHAAHLGDRNLVEPARRVTDFAVRAEVPGVGIAVTFEATMTSHWERKIRFRGGYVLPLRNAQGRGPRLMARRTSRLLVRPNLGELRHAVVVEFRRALLRTVALGAVLTQLATMLVVLLVAVEAAVLVQRVLVLSVTGLARERRVLAFKFECLVLEIRRARGVET